MPRGIRKTPEQRQEELAQKLFWRDHKHHWPKHWGWTEVPILHKEKYRERAAVLLGMREATVVVEATEDTRQKWASKWGITNSK